MSEQTQALIAAFISQRKCYRCEGCGIVAGAEYTSEPCPECKGTGVLHRHPPIVYVAGPFRADTPWGVLTNVRRAEVVSKQLWDRGVFNICPHLLGANLDKSVPDRVMLAGTLEIARRCDALLLCMGWESSSGTLGEREAMRALGRPVFGEEGFTKGFEALLAWHGQWHT